MPVKAKKEIDSFAGEDIKKKPVKRGRKPALKKNLSKLKKAEKKVFIPKPLPKRVTVKKEIRTEEKSFKPEPLKAKEKRNLGKSKKIVPILITFIITAFLVGTPFYYWQQNSGNGDLSEIQRDARETRMSFEQRLEQLKNKLTGVESENEELKNQQEELAKRAELLKGSKKEFYSPDLGLSFEYPAIFGNVTIEFEQAATGTLFKGTFSNTESLNFVGISNDFISSAMEVASTSTITLTENWGFAKRSGNYYYVPVVDLDERFYIEPVKVLDLGGADALLLNASSFDFEEEEKRVLPLVEVGAPLVAIINLDSEEYSSVTFLNQKLEELPQEDFETVIESILVE